ncbi:SPI-7-type island replicative DNA helicase [Erwinia amylovora]|uniref:SPI-7-type island replicative DNA helicase n=1 Tax=Erwinia amylovora TaxID=552 RepID=UPI000C0808EF|nr:SPI-7-type island replicative DNA helicase [Erwinia amylovora]
MKSVEAIPRSIEAEQAVLGGLMLDNDRWDEVVLVLAPEDFSNGSHRAIYREMAELAIESLPLDLITISEKLENKGLLTGVGGFAYLAEMSKNTPSAANIMAYSAVVREKSRLRNLMAIGNNIVSDVNAPNADAASVMESAESKIFQLAQQGMEQGTSEMGMQDSLNELVSKLEALIQQGGMPGTPMGFSELDSMTSGLQAGDLILLAARPSMGKTSFALAACLAAAREKPDESVFIFSLEMPRYQLMMRMVSMVGRIELEHLRSAKLSDEDWGRICNGVQDLMPLDKLIIDDTSYQTPATLRARARRYVRKYGSPSLIMVDYLQLMTAPGMENRTQEIAEISRSLKALGKELGCPIVALSQLNRQVEQRADKRPNNGDLRDSGALEQDADLIMFIYRDEFYNVDSEDAGVAEIIIGKQRQGPTGTVKVQFDGRFTLFSDFQTGSFGHDYRGGQL